MRKYFFIFAALFMFASCANVTGEVQERVFDGQSIGASQKILKKLPINTPLMMTLDDKAPRAEVTDSLWTDPCTLEYAKLSASTNEWEKGYNLDALRCSVLKGPWIATFVLTGNKEPLPALLRPDTDCHNHKRKALTPLKIYLAYDATDFIVVLVDDPG